MPMSLLLLIVFGLYFLCLLALLYGWEKMLQQKAPQSGKHHSISVIVPLRNEQAHVAQLVDSLKKQSYPSGNSQVIFVNDHSTDETRNLLTNLRSNFFVFDLSEATGKKAAISLGVEKANGEIIVTTDADCTHHPDWLQTINNQFSNPKLQLLVGPVAIQSDSFFSRLQAIEFSSLIGSGAALLQWNTPTMANGANLGFRREAFLAVNGYEGNQHIASGDDEFLLRKIQQKFPYGISFNNDELSVVMTEPQPTLAAFFQQRIRWASKWKHNTSLLTKLIAVIVFLFQVSIIALLIAVSICPNRPLQIIVFSKFAIDGIFLWRISTFLKTKFSFLAFIVLEFVYPIYVIVIALLSQFVPYKWKGRIF
jgi:biofilm PGA synthesis N-glycosyltransferase PgaC